MAEPCYSCRAGFHNECIQPTAHIVDSNFQVCCCFADIPTAAMEVMAGSGTIPLDTRRAEKANDDIRDQTSTGRKRAAAMYPIPSIHDGGMVCEWAWLSKAGGGAVPIVGCRGNTIADIKEKIFEDDGITVLWWPGNAHHGPDKSTLNNELGNVHRICPLCHGRWHTLNDPLYGVRPDAGRTFLPLSGIHIQHDPITQATTDELDYSDLFWTMPNKQRSKVPYRLDTK